MTESNLSQTVDIGGDKYFMGSQQPIELGFKSRANFNKAFDNSTKTEQLIRKYLFFSLIPKTKLKIDNPTDKKELIKILKTRSSKIEESGKLTSSILKNTVLQRSYINIQKIIQELEGASTATSNKATLPVILDKCVTDKQYITTISKDHLFWLMLEISWYLLHPDKVPKDIECDWASIIAKLDTLHIDDIITQIKKDSTHNHNNEKPFNYFKKINLDNVMKEDTSEKALIKAKDILQTSTQTPTSATQTAATATATATTQTAATARQTGGEIMNNMSERIKTILTILTINKYLNKGATINNMSKALISNHMNDNFSKTLDKSLNIAMNPLFDYFKVVYDPVYSVIEKGVNNIISNTNNLIIPQLTTLLHICNNINYTKHGIYRLTNVNSELISFINAIILSTKTYIDNFHSDKEKYIFNKQVFSLPKVRLSLLLKNSINTTFNNFDTIQYIQFFTVGSNMTLLSEDAFINSKSKMTDDVFNAVTDFFIPTNLYIVCTKSDNIYDNIPMNMYEINYNKIDIGDKNINIDNLPNSYFNKNRNSELHLENLVSLTPYAVYNDAELALSILLAFKELMLK